MSFRLDWSSVDLDGVTMLTDGDETVGVEIRTPEGDEGTASGAEHAAVELRFDAPVSDVRFQLYDGDGDGGASSPDADWGDRVSVIALDAEGNEVPVSFSDSRGMHGEDEDEDEHRSGDAEHDGDGAGGVTVTIEGPVSAIRIVHSSDDDDDEAGSGDVVLGDVTFARCAPALDGIVEGTAGDDVIDIDYTGDPEGDRIDAGDAIDPHAGPDDDVVEAGDGNDRIAAGEGDDSVEGGAGDDTLDGGAGADTLRGGDDADWFTVGSADEADGDVIDGGSGGDDHDTLDLTGVEAAEIRLLDVVPDKDGTGIDGRVEFRDAHGAVIGTAQFTDIETVVGLPLDGVVEGTEGADLIDLAYDGDPEGDRVDAGDAIIPGAGPDDDVIAGYGGDDTIYGLAGDDIIDGGTGDDSLSGGEGNDELVGAEGRDTLSGAAGDDVVDGGDDDDTLHGGSGDDSLFGGEDDGADLIVGGSGSDTVEAGDGDDTIDTGGGLDLAKALGTPDIAYPGVTVADADPDDDRDLVYAGDGDDVVETGDDADWVSAGKGDDTVFGGIDNDSLYGGAGNDSLVAGEGADSVRGHEGDDTIYGGLGAPDDPLNIPDDGSAPAGPDLAPHNGTDFLDGGAGNDLIFGEDDDDTLEGGEGDDTLDGGIDDDHLDGGTGNDSLIGGQGIDTILGGDGQDTIVAGVNDIDVETGGDFVDGGADEDLILVRSMEEGVDDTILGGSTATFGRDYDTLDLTGAGPLRIVNQVPDSDGNGIDGTVEFLDEAGHVVGTFEFRNIEKIITDDLRDGIVEGTDGDDLIDVDYDGDPEGDRIDAGDAIDPEAGPDDDVVEAGDGDDTVEAGLGDDLVQGGGGDDTLSGEEGDDTLLGGEGGEIPNRGYPGLQPADPAPEDDEDLLDGGVGDDVLDGGDDDDTLYGGAGDDSLDGGVDDDLIDGGEGDDTILGGEGQDIVHGGEGDDVIDGSEPDGSLLASLPDDGSDPAGPDLDAHNDRDSLDGGAGNDRIFGGDDDDTLLGGAGDDTLDGGIDDDTLSGGEGADSLVGGQGHDTLHGGTGSDTLIGGAGSDSMAGGADEDTFLVQDGDEGIGDTIAGGSEGVDYDTLDLTGSGPFRVVDLVTDSDGNGFDGRVEFLDGPGGSPRGDLTFTNIENIICFTPGTRITTPEGERAVEDLTVGDRVLTRDNGVREIAWYGQTEVDAVSLAARPEFRPVLIRAGSLGEGLPARDMMVSPMHRVLIADDRNALYFDEREVLVAARHLIDGRGILRAPVERVTYVHFMFDTHEIVLSDGAWTESFQPGDYSLAGLDGAQRAEILSLFPQLATQIGLGGFAAARRSLKRHEAYLLAR